MFRLVLASLIIIFSINTFCQSISPNKVSKDRKAITEKKLVKNPKTFLENAVLRSKKVEKVKVYVETSLGNSDISSTFEFLAPNKYKFVDVVSGKTTKIAIEIARQRFQLHNEKWIKTKEDYFPLRDQFDLFFPIKFRAENDDIFIITNVKVEHLEDEKIGNRDTLKFRYEIKYDDPKVIDAGIVWIDEKDELLTQIETESAGFLGRVNAKWKYFYDVEIIIKAPKDFIEQDWIN